LSLEWDECERRVPDVACDFNVKYWYKHFQSLGKNDVPAHFVSSTKAKIRTSRVQDRVRKVTTPEKIMIIFLGLSLPCRTIQVQTCIPSTRPLVLMSTCTAVTTSGFQHLSRKLLLVTTLLEWPDMSVRSCVLGHSVRGDPGVVGSGSDR
jgi:hypothetical protein